MAVRLTAPHALPTLVCIWDQEPDTWVANDFAAFGITEVNRWMIGLPMCSPSQAAMTEAAFSIPWNRPWISCTPSRAMTTDGEWIPNTALKKSTIPCQTLFAQPGTVWVKNVVAPWNRPMIRFLPELNR